MFSSLSESQLSAPCLTYDTAGMERAIEACGVNTRSKKTHQRRFSQYKLFRQLPTHLQPTVRDQLIKQHKFYQPTAVLLDILKRMTNHTSQHQPQQSKH